MLANLLNNCVKFKHFSLHPLPKLKVNVTRHQIIIQQRSFHQTTLLGFSDLKTETPTIPTKIRNSSVINKVEFVDEYKWMQDKSSPRLRKHLKVEAKHFTEQTSYLKPLENEIYSEMLSKMDETDDSVKKRVDDYYYYTTTKEGFQYPTYCRSHISSNVEEVLLDVNKLAEGHEYFNIGSVEPSSDHSMIAYSVDTVGDECHTLFVKNIKTGEIFPNKIKNLDSFAWANDNKHIIYTVLDNVTLRPHRVYCHHLGDKKDQIVFHEKDEKFHVGVDKTSDNKYILIECESNLSTETWFLDAEKPTEKFVLVQERIPEVAYNIEHNNGQFFILTNYNAKNYKVCVTSVSKPSKENWVDLIPHREDVSIEGLEQYKDFMVLHEQKEGLPQINIISNKDKSSHYVTFDEPIYSTSGLINWHEFETNRLGFSYSSFVTPNTAVVYDMMSKTREIKKVEIVHNYDPSLYIQERIFATGRDGVKIPISMVYRKDMVKQGQENKCLLYAYGAYGDSSEVAFSSHNLPLLDRGVIYAIAHVRGGEEMGCDWYEKGRLLYKMNSFYDFIDCAKHLIKEKYTAPNRLGIMGDSAGGLVMGAVLNMAPELFKVAMMRVPFVDVISSLSDPSLPLTATEWEEWGNPQNPKELEYMRQYTPYGNIRSTSYPAIFVTAGLHDSSVQYWEAAKYVARLRALKTDNNPLLLRIDMKAGHKGPSGRYDSLRELALEYAFVLDMLNK